MAPSPHDALVRYAFSDIAHARGMLQSLCPMPLLELLDWDTLTLEDGSFIDPQLSERQTDLLYRVEVDGAPMYLYLLLEHQSSDDHFMAYRMLVYVTRIWDRLLRAEPTMTRLPPVVPLVLHHSERGWRAPTELSLLIDGGSAMRSALGPMLPSLAFQLTDLTQQTDAALHGWLTTDLGKLVALCLKHGAYEKHLDERLVEWLDLLGAVVRAPGGVAALDVIGRYLLRVNDLPVDRMRDVLEQGLQPETVEAIVSEAERQRELGRQEGRVEADRQRELGRREGEAEGEARGRAEGEARGRAEVLLKLLQLKFGDLPAPTVSFVHGATIQQLDQWTERVLSATTLAEVLDA